MDDQFPPHSMMFLLSGSTEDQHSIPPLLPVSSQIETFDVYSSLCDFPTFLLSAEISGLLFLDERIWGVSPGTAEIRNK